MTWALWFTIPIYLIFMDAKMKSFSTLTLWLFILCIPTLLLSASIGWATNSLWMYKYGSHKYHVVQSLADSGLHLSDVELEQVYSGLTDYFNSDKTNIKLTVIKAGKPFDLFTPEEVIHFKDVKDLVRLDYWLFLGTLTYILAYAGVFLIWRQKLSLRRLAWAGVAGVGFTLALIVAVGLGSLVGFSQLFWQFHLLFFNNVHWAAKGYMLMLFPLDFFYFAALFCVSIFAGLAVIVAGMSGGYLVLTRNNHT